MRSDKKAEAPSAPPHPALRVPRFIDLQVNGYAGVDFNRDGLSAEGLHAACERLRADGVDRILATVITDDLARMAGRLARLAELRESDPLTKEVIAGFHIEGPFLNESPGYIGAHPAAQARTAEVASMGRLLDATRGLTQLVTLAPERDPGLAVTRMLVNRGIRVAAGHTDASLDGLRAALDAGLSMFTHLGNGCPQQMHRHDNIVQRVLHLAHHFDTISLIADGAHIPYFTLNNYLKLIGPERVVVVSDAIAAAGLGPGHYTMLGQPIVVGNDLVPRSPDRSHFVGSACPMARMAENLREHLGVEEASIHRWTRGNPMRVMTGG